MIRRIFQSPLYKQHAGPVILLFLAVIVIWYPVTFLGYTIARAPIVDVGAPTFRQIENSSIQAWPVQDSYASATQDEPWSVLIGSALRSGSLPLVNMFNGLGAPLAETMQAGVFYPGNIVLAFLPLSNPVAFDLFVLLHALIFVYGLYALYCVFASRWIATIVAILIGGSGVVWSNSNMVHFRSFAWLPWIFLLSFLILQGRRGRLLPLLLASVIICNITAGSLQDSVISLGVVIVVSALYGLTLRPLPKLSVALRYSMTVFSGIAISSIAFIPFFVSRASEQLALQADSARSLQSVNWYYMMSWILPKFKGIYPFFVYSSTDQQNQPDVPTVFWVFVIMGCCIALQQLYKLYHGPRLSVDKVRISQGAWFMLALLFVCLIGLVKTAHIGLFDFVQYIPFIESLKFAKYNLWIAVLGGVVAAWGLTQWSKAPAVEQRRIGALSVFGVLGMLIVAFVSAAIAGNAPWQAAGASFPSIVQDEVLMSLCVNILGVFVIGAILWFVRNQTYRLTSIFLCSVVILLLMMPGGWYKRSAIELNSGQVRALQTTVNEVSKDPTQQLQDRPRLLITRPHSNRSILYGFESMTVWDPILQKSYRDFLVTHFPVATPSLLLEPTRDTILNQQHIDALRFLGVDAIAGYQVVAEKNVTLKMVNNREVFFIDHALPRAFYLSNEEYDSISALQASGASLDVILGAVFASIERVGADTVEINRISTNGMDIAVRGPVDGRLIVLQAASSQWTLNQKKSSDTFLGLYPAWQIDSPVNNSDTQLLEMRYQLAGARLILVFVSIGLIILICVTVLGTDKKWFYEQRDDSR